MFGRAHTGKGLPAACGALGEFDPDAVGRMAATQGAGLAEVHRDPHSILLLDRDSVHWEGNGARGVAWGERLPVDVANARSWEEAARAGALGLIVEGDRRAVHASVSGIGPVYWRRDGDVAYFATEIAPLVEALAPPLTPDWESWASIIVLGYPCGDGTPFAEIKRLNPSAVLDQSPGGAPRATGGGLAWAEIQPTDPDDAAERIITGLREDIGALDPELSVYCPLSGGWDSRLLVCLLAEREDVKPSAWSINSDFGDGRDETFAAAVAAELGIAHTVLEAGQRPFADELREAAQLVEHGSMLHLVTLRVAAGLPNGRAVVVDGLAGDVLLKDLFVTKEILEAPDWRTAVGLTFDGFVPPGGGAPLFGAARWERLREAARASYLSESARFAEHPATATLAAYWARTRRGVSQAPVRLIGSRHPVAMPFLNDDVVRASFSLSPPTKLDRSFYRRLLDLARPGMGTMPSTNDDLPPPPRNRPRLARSRAARRAYVEILAASPIRPWLSDELRDALEERKLGRLARSFWRVQRLQNLASLSLWLERYRGSLVDLDLAELFGGPPSSG